LIPNVYLPKFFRSALSGDRSICAVKPRHQYFRPTIPAKTSSVASFPSLICLAQQPNGLLERQRHPLPELETSRPVVPGRTEGQSSRAPSTPCAGEPMLGHNSWRSCIPGDRKPVALGDLGLSRDYARSSVTSWSRALLAGRPGLSMLLVQPEQGTTGSLPLKSFRVHCR
jgi:hypothetical protein